MIASQLCIATGDGEKIMQFCPSFHIVQLMKSGRSPQQACDEVVRQMKEGSQKWFEVGVIALDHKVSTTRDSYRSGGGGDIPMHP